ncbi:MAG: GNAT family N-acetyltransferase [Clostridia bacterium]|nr:GNAT family N-acetyltransferase [Clostridia bacterium]
MYTGKYATSKSALETALTARALIPEFSAERDNYDDMAVYVFAYDDDNELSGCGRLYIDDDSQFRIDLLGVVPAKRGRYIGDLLARMLLFRAQQLNAASVHVTVPADTVRFFARYGFKAVQDVNSANVNMSVNANDIILEGSCKKGRNASCTGNCESCGA